MEAGLAGLLLYDLCLDEQGVSYGVAGKLPLPVLCAVLCGVTCRDGKGVASTGMAGDGTGTLDAGITVGEWVC